LVHTPHAYGALATSAVTATGAPAGYIGPALSISVVALAAASLRAEI